MLAIVKKKIAYHEIHPDVVTSLDKDNKTNFVPSLMLRMVLMTNTYILQKHEALCLDKLILFRNKQKMSQLKTRVQKRDLKKY